MKFDHWEVPKGEVCGERGWVGTQQGRPKQSVLWITLKGWLLPANACFHTGLGPNYELVDVPFGRRGRIAPEMKGWLSVSHAGRSGFVPIIDSLLKRLAVRAWSTDCGQIVWTNFIRNSLKDRADKVFSLSSEIKTTDLKRKPKSSKSFKNTLKKLIDSKI